MERLLIVTALPQELDHAPIPYEHPVVFTGIGKLNAAVTLMDAISKHSPAMVINFGTAGRLSAHASGLVEVAEVIQRDMDAEPLSPRGTTPFDETPTTIASGFEGVRCGTGDSFMRSTDSWLLDQQVDIVDMELFALALVCHRRGVAWRSFKYITDDTDENAGRDWMERIHHGRALFLKKLTEIGST
ncbi:phosphorylase family protein [Orrella marina]|uniref:5'-methylthioadenosine nucleosidase n=1 Tax=Orrella marina TaxID=2163011 RepID=A0A2R4XKJ2_9BURK|nr:5'-methylthioadenosine nucleosidase [Orrella marina]AWB34306.1 5'-methylthioadenosine nucleosidase [Orrella marina]